MTEPVNSTKSNAFSCIQGKSSSSSTSSVSSSIITSSFFLLGFEFVPLAAAAAKMNRLGELDEREKGLGVNMALENEEKLLVIVVLVVVILLLSVGRNGEEEGAAQ